MTKRLPRWLLLILLLALSIRLIALSSRMLWYDEAFAVLFSEKGLSAMLFGTLAPADTGAVGAAADVHPLLYYTTLGGWMRIFGQSPAAVRLYGVLLGVVTIFMLYLLVRDLFGERTAIVTALIAALAPFHVQYSQEARMYALLGLILVSATWCFVRGWRTGQRNYWIGFGVLAALAMYTQQLAAFYLLALGLIPLVARRRNQVVRVGLSVALAVIIYLPWLVNLPAQFSKLGNYWIQVPGPVQPLITLWSFIMADLPVMAVVPMIAGTVTLVLLVVLLLYRVVRQSHGMDGPEILFVVWLVVVPIAAMWLFSQWRPVYLTRALLPSGLMFYGAVGWLLTRARLPRSIVALLSLIMLITAGFGLFNHYTWNTFPRPPFDQADQMIVTQRQDGDQVVHANKLTMLPMVYYNRGLPQHYIRDIPGSSEDTLARATQEVLGLLADECIAQAAQAAPRVWFVIFQQQIVQEGGEARDLRWLDAHYHQVSVMAFNDLLVYLYDQPDTTAQSATCEDGA